jgi:uncharacterized protein YkwD
MRRPGRGVTGVAVALAVAAIAGGVLSSSLMHSGASKSSLTKSQVLVLFNRERAAHGLARLTADPKLAQAADSHSADMLRHGYFSHNGPQGKWDVRIRRYVDRSMVAEILSYGSGRYATPSGMVSAWMHSPEHRRIILMPGLRRVGLGIATGEYRGQSRTAMATADFSSS